MTIPKNFQRQLKQQMQEYLTDSNSIVQECTKAASSEPQFLAIYRASLSAASVLTSLNKAGLKPSLDPALNIVLRIPMLTATGQGTTAKAELRRYLELVLWTVYFTDHPIEWIEFSKESTSGFERDTRKPIAYAARRELSYYLDYARELMESEPSGLGIKSITDLREASFQLNAAVHAGRLARNSTKSVPFEKPEKNFLTGLAKLQRNMFASSCTLFAAYRRAQFGRLDAAARAHFDWLVGTELRKKVRSGPFGLQ